MSELAEREYSAVGKINTIYRVDTKYRLADGSFMVVNFWTIKKYESYPLDGILPWKNVIVIQNVPPIYDTASFMNQAAYFAAFDTYGNEIKVGDIHWQRGGEFTDIIVEVGELNSVKYLEVGSFDRTLYGKSSLIFQVD
jgi:hypothetical protein